MAVNEQAWFVKHLENYLSDPVSAHDWDASPVGGTGIVPTLLLHTTGAKSGQPRDVPLLYMPCGDGFVVIASRGGSHRHPGWYLNLQADPICAAQVGCMRYRLSAQTLTADVRARYWDLMTRFWPPYLDYQARTARAIPVVKLTILAASGPA